ILLNTARIAEAHKNYRDAKRFYSGVLASETTDPGFRWEAHQGLANVALGMGEPGVARGQFEAALATIEETQAGLLKTEYRISFLARLIRFYEEYVDALVADGSIDKALEVADSSRARVLAEREGAGAPVARRVSSAQYRRLARTTDSILLFYWLGPVHSYAWV